MDERNEELERIQKQLLAEDETITLRDVSVDDILADEELNAILNEKKVPAFEDPDQIHTPKGDMQYNNYANAYGREDPQEDAEADRKNDKVLIGLMIAACVLCLGIIGVLIYWLNILP